MKQLKLGSLFDGSGGFPLGGLLCGIEPVWASEIEPFPIRVTTKRFPQVKHLGDISCVNGAEIEPVDIITFGSPCTDLSVAGRRDGLSGKQSGLFFEAVRIIKEMREATNGTYPRWIIWENVPGAFSSNAGADFAQVLTEIVRVAEPQAPEVPAAASWPPGDALLGDGWSVAYRVIDAAAWVPQRRKRIYLVADFGSERAADILFEREGVSRDFAAGGFPWQGAPGGAAPSPGGAVSFEPGIFGRLGKSLGLEIAGTLRADMGDNQTATAIPINTQVGLRNHKDGDGTGLGIGADGDPAYTLQAAHSHAVAVYDARGNGDGMTANTITGDHNGHISDYTTLVAFAQNQRNEVRDLRDCAGSLAAEPGMKQQTYIMHREPAAYGIGNGQADQRPSPEMVGTLNCMHDQQAVIIDCRNHRAGAVSCTLQAKGGGGHSLNYINPVAVAEQAVAVDCRHDRIEEISGTLVAKSSGGNGVQDNNPVMQNYIVRRLTPRECAKLQGFPLDWCAGLETPEPTEEDIAFWSEVWETHRRVCGKAAKPKTRNQIVKWLRAPHTDSAEYKMWGNGVALPCVCFVMAGIREAMDN